VSGSGRFHIAEINVARLVAPLDDPRVAEFVAQLDAVNAEADASDGFVWRLKSETGGASTYVHAFEDPQLLINISVWTSIEQLHQFVYRARGHAAVFRDRRNWFGPTPAPLAMWWIPVNHRPTIDEAKDRLRRLRELGPTPDAFTFKSRFPAPSTS
jgi:hypothetical protein